MEDCSIHCLEQIGIAVDVVCCISQLSAEMSATADDDDDDLFFTLDDDKDDLEENELTVEDTKWFHLVTYFFAQVVHSNLHYLN